MKLLVSRLSQNDNRWKTKKLGTSSVCTIGSDGCLLTSVCMVLRYFGKDIYPDKLNDNLVKIGGFYQGARLVWGKVSELYPDIPFDWDVFNKGDCPDIPAPLDLIDKLLSEKVPVIVKLDFDPGGELNEHWVLIVGKEGDYIINDPWTGEEYFFTAKYKDPSRYIFAIRAYRGKVPVELFKLYQGGVELKEYEKHPDDTIFDLETKLKTANDQLSLKIMEADGYRNALTQQEADNKDLIEQLAGTRAERDTVIREKENLAGEIKILRQETDNLRGSIDSQLKEIASLESTLKALKSDSVAQMSSWELVSIIIKRFFGK